jgi:thiamine-phosphate pyrophosphorylase
VLETPIIRILDASLNRAAEGLRVVEDYVRFILDDPFLSAQTKALRHDLAAASTLISVADRHAARDTQGDVGIEISNESEGRRDDAWAVCAASLKRSEQSLRSLEEYGKLVDADFAGRCESLRYRVYTLEKAIDVGRSSRDRLLGVRLCVLIDGGNSVAEFSQLVSELVEAGVDMIQLRDKVLDDRALAERARKLVSLTRREDEAPAEPNSASPPTARQEPRPPRTLAIINDRADIAVAVQADGVHVGQEDLSVKDARAIVGTQMLIGVSTHNIEQARDAVLDGANYLGAGPTFPSSTKAFDHFAGLSYLREVAAEIRLPTFAIGGITAANLMDVLSTGVTRVAVGAAVTEASDPLCAGRELLAMLSDTPTTMRTAADFDKLSPGKAASPVPPPVATP